MDSTNSPVPDAESVKLCQVCGLRPATTTTMITSIDCNHDRVEYYEVPACWECAGPNMPDEALPGWRQSEDYDPDEDGEISEFDALAAWLWDIDLEGPNDWTDDED